VEFIVPAPTKEKSTFGGPKAKVSISNLSKTSTTVAIAIAVTDAAAAWWVSRPGHEAFSAARRPADDLLAGLRRRQRRARQGHGVQDQHRAQALRFV
jgi:hypothetical protein